MPSPEPPHDLDRPGPPADDRAGEALAGRTMARPETHVVLAVDVVFPSAALVRHLREFQAAFPHVELEIRAEPVGGVAQLVLGGVADLGVGVGPIPPGLRSAPSKIVPSAPVAGAGHPLARLRGVLEREQLQDHVQIVLAERCRPGLDPQRGILSARSWRVADPHTKRALLIAGFGWGTLPLHLIEEDLRSGRLVRLSLRGHPPLAGLRLTTMVRRGDPPGPVRRWLLERLGSGLRGAARSPTEGVA